MVTPPALGVTNSHGVTGGVYKARERIHRGIKFPVLEDRDAWESEEEIARQYIHNMGALYSANGSEAWGETREGVNRGLWRRQAEGL